MMRTLLRADRKLVGDRVQGFVDRNAYPTRVMLDDWRAWGREKRQLISGLVDSVFQEFGDVTDPRGGDVIRPEATPSIVEMGWDKLADFCLRGVDLNPVFVGMTQTEGLER